MDLNGSECIIPPSRINDSNVDTFFEFAIWDEKQMSLLREEIQAALRNFSRLQTWLVALSKEKDRPQGCHGEPIYSKAEKNSLIYSLEKWQLLGRTSEKSQVALSSEGKTEAFEFEGGCLEKLNDGKINEASSFFDKFKEAQDTVEEAGLTLDALLKAKEDAQELTKMWKQAGVDHKGERDNLLEQVLQLKSQNGELMVDKINHGQEVVTNSFYSLEECFSDIQSEVESWLNKFQFDVLSMMEDVQYSLRSMRSLIESICSELMAKDLASIVLWKNVGNSYRELVTCNIGGSFPTSKRRHLLPITEDAAGTCSQNMEKKEN